MENKISLKELGKLLNKDRGTLLRHLENSQFELIKEVHGNITKIFINKNDVEKIKEFMKNKDSRGGIRIDIPNDKITISKLVKLFHPHKRTAITTSLKYLGYDFEKIGNVHVYDKTCINKLGDFLNDEHKQSKLVKKRNYNESNSKGAETKRKNSLDFEKENDLIKFSSLSCLNGHFEQDILNLCKNNNIDVIYNKGIRYVKYNDVDAIESLSKELNRSTKEMELREWIKSFYDGDVVFDNRKIISPKELDIYFPKEKIAIEFNGIYWHSELNVNKNYHLNKTIECEKKNIKLIHIFEDEWLNKQEIIKSIIKCALNKFNKKIYARKCELKIVSTDESKIFLNENHIQGYINGDNYGLYYNDKLVQMITLGKNRFKKNEIELLRMCTKLNTQVIGGFSKLMKNQPYNEVHSYIDRRLFNGKGYFSCNWKFERYSQPSYTYFIKGKRENRMNWQKHHLKDKLKIYDKSLTEHQNMNNNGFYRIYDCGTIKVKYTKNN